MTPHPEIPLFFLKDHHTISQISLISNNVYVKKVSDIFKNIWVIYKQSTESCKCTIFRDIDG